MDNRQLEPQGVEIKKVPERYERLQEIFLLLQSLPAFTSETEAYVGLENAFEAVEKKYYPRFESRIQESIVGGDLLIMSVHGIDHHIACTHGSVGVIYADKHYAFIGENGAIEIQEGNRSILINANPHNKIVFEKKGADGHGVWE
jgi:hypothetical protein